MKSSIGQIMIGVISAVIAGLILAYLQGYPPFPAGPARETSTSAPLLPAGRAEDRRPEREQGMASQGALPRHPDEPAPSAPHLPSAAAEPAKNAPPAPQPALFLISKVITLEDVYDPEKTSLPFPAGFFRDRLSEALGNATTGIPNIRIGVAFVEPISTRRYAAGGSLIGFILVSLEAVPGCRRKFGGQAYIYRDAETGLMKAIAENAAAIAKWIQLSAQGETLTCAS